MCEMHYIIYCLRSLETWEYCTTRLTRCKRDTDFRALHRQCRDKPHIFLLQSLRARLSQSPPHAEALGLHTAMTEKKVYECDCYRHCKALKVVSRSTWQKHKPYREGGEMYAQARMAGTVSNGRKRLRKLATARGSRPKRF